jgi:hypothetical protein
MDGNAHLHGGLHLERQNDKLIVESVHTAEWLGAIFGIFAFLWIVGWLANFTYGEPGYWIGPAIAVASIGAGIFFMMPRVVTTAFDLQSRQVFHKLSIGNDWYKHNCTCAFAEIAGVGVKEYYHEGFSYLPLITLVDGKKLWLGTCNDSYLTFANSIEVICTATGLQKLDV